MPVNVRIEVSGLRELRRRFAAYPQKLDAAMQRTMEAALLVLQESVPPYPPQPPASDYRRTGTLGRTLGSSTGGGTGAGRADIHQVRRLGMGGWSGEFGTRLKYAPHVIGEGTQARHMSHWWTILTVARKAVPKIDRLFHTMAGVLARYLERGGV